MRRPQLSLQFIKTPKPTLSESTLDPQQTLDYVQLVQTSAKSVAKYVALGLAGWIILDTGRQCAIKATPQR